MADQSTYSEQVVRQAPWLEDYQRRLLASTEELVDQPYEQYSGAEIAGFSQDQLKSFDLARQGIGAYEPYLEESGAYARAAPATFGSSVPETQGMYRSSVGAFDPSTQVQPYMDPYQRQVTDQSLQELNRQFAMKQNELAAGAAQSGAFGGARHGVAEAELGRGQAQAQAQMLSQDYSRNYNQALQAAQGNFEKQQANQLRAGAGLSDLAQTQSGLMQKASEQVAGLGGLEQGYRSGDVSQLSQSGSIQQSQLQKGIDIDRQRFTEAQMQPYQRIGAMSDILQGVPSTQSTLTASTAPSASSWAQGIGGLSAIAGLGGSEGFGWWGGDSE